ncbi:MAG: hypothetical protein N4A45_10905 [Flavobacteriales bacterium]|jgi:hypothetical protein|nr:hypothetical protein [Flavobacteriales bacterium]
MEISGTYTISNYTVSLKELLLKNTSYENMEIEEIVFIGVSYLQIPSTIFEPIISFGCEKDFNYIDKQLIGTTIYWQFENLFVITDEDNNKYYIVASQCKIVRSNGDVLFYKPEKGIN